MSEDRVDHTYNVWAEQHRWLEEMAEKYDLSDAGKALRVVLEYAMRDGDEDEIFGEVRCHHCG